MKTSSKIILDIVPLTRIPLSRGQSFSYLSDKKLSAGALVSIPLFKRKVNGIVIGSKPDFPHFGNIKLKKIDATLEENFLDEKQLELARFISDYYICPLGIVLKFFVPKRVKSRNPQPITYNLQPGNKIILTKEQKKAVDEITKKTTNYKLQTTNHYLFGPSGSGKTEVYIYSILKLATYSPRLQFLILLPELMLTPQAVERYGAYFKLEEIVVLNSKISKGSFYHSWQKIKSGEAKIIIGSRMAVFAPFKKLGLIVIDEEQDISFKQWDMSPRYDAKKVAKKLAIIHKTKIIFGSATPSIESYYRAEKKELKLLTLPAFPPGRDKIQNSEISLVDMRKERWKGKAEPANFSPISKKLQAEINYALKNKLQTILFINRQGMSNFSICADCRAVLKCPRCDRALVYGAAGNYKCAHCSYKTSITPQCSKCKGLRFTNIGLGTQKIEREINSLFPQARVARADNQSMQASGSQEKIYEEFSAGRIDILIGTQMISKSWDLPTVALVGIIDADNLYSIPDFSANARAYQNIVQVSGRVGRPGAKFPGTVVIQTYNPENSLLKLSAEKNFKAFFQKEISERKALSLPPFGKLIKLVCQGYGREKIEVETRGVYGILIKKKLTGVQISEPHDPLVTKIRGRFRKQIIIKFKKEHTEIPAAVQTILKNLSTDWIIDIDPISIA